MEAKLEELVKRLQQALQANLKSVVLFGSAVTGEFSEPHSDVNLLCVVGDAGLSSLETIHEAVKGWVQKGNPAPLVFTLQGLNHSADVFAIELLDIREKRRVLYGPDIFENLEVPTRWHRRQVERELRLNCLRLRQHIVTAPKKERARLELMVASVASFVALFRHGLMEIDGVRIESSAQVVDRAAALVSADPGAFHAILKLKKDPGGTNKIDVEQSLHGYLEMAELFTAEIDRRFESDDRRPNF